MEAKTIEKFDRQRYWAVVLQAVALVDIFVETALYYALHWDSSVPSLNISGIVGLPLFLVAGIWYLAIEGRIVRNRELRSALHNEMYLAYKHRSQQIALWVVMCALLVGMLTGEITISYPGYIFCEVAFFLGLATLKTSWLILNRNRK
jgi:uncharacterized membrane protein